ncbi:MAG: AAA family ATPase [Solirubrobacterales bacterium]
MPRGENPILIVTGPPGVGKTTAAGILAARWDRAVHLEADAFFRFIRGGYVEPWRPESHPQNQAVMRIVAGAAAGYTDAGYFTIVDGIVIPGWFFEPLREALGDAGHAVAYAVLRAPLEVCLARGRSREGEMPVDAGAIEQLWRSFADLGDLEENALDVGGMDAEEVSGQLAERLAGGLLAV